MPRKTLHVAMTFGLWAALSCGPGARKQTEEGVKVTKELFGKTAEGQDVDIYTLRNKSGVEVRITNYGGIVVSLKAPDRAGKLDDIVLGFDSLCGYLGDHPYFGAIVGRYGNRIAKADSG